MTFICCGFAFVATKSQSSTITVSKLKISKSLIFLILAILTMVLVSGFRWETGVDHINYYYVFTNILYDLNTHVEVGFQLICELVLLFTEDMWVMFFICSVLTGIFLTIGIRLNSTNYLISIFLYISMGFFYYSLNSIRHYLALSIYLIAYYYLRKRKLEDFLVYILIASIFHKIAFIAIPLYFLLNIKYKKYWYGIFSAILVVLMILNRQILDLLYKYAFTFYQSIEDENSGYSLVNIGITLALSILCLIYEKRLLIKDKANIILINASYFGFLFFLLCGWIPVYTRIGQYLTILTLFLVPKLIECEENEKIKLLYKIGLFVGFSFFMIVILINSKDPSIALIPYKSIFSR